MFITNNVITNKIISNIGFQIKARFELLPLLENASIRIVVVGHS